MSLVAPRPTLSPAMVWLMRLLAGAGLGIGAFLSYTQFVLKHASDRATVPLCGGLSWLDCNTVLNSTFGKWFGLPAALPAVGLYLLMLGALFAPRKKFGKMILIASAPLLLAAGGWYTWMQATVLGQWCAWCMAEHVIGAALAVLIGLYWVDRWTAGRAVALVVIALAGAGVLEAGQKSAAGYTRSLTAQVGAEGIYRETLGPDDQARPLGEAAIINASAHPRIGLPTARQLIVEVVDYRCAKCAKMLPVIHGALERLGPDVAILIVFWPLDAKCNRHLPVEASDSKYGDSCQLAQLGAAVWLADATKFGLYHQWAFAQGQDLSAQAAEEYARKLVGSRALEQQWEEARRLIGRDVELVNHLDLPGLPGLIVGQTMFSAIPEEPDVLARVIGSIFGQGRH